jgi:sugar lactone lactonase YvrE
VVCSHALLGTKPNGVAVDNAGSVYLADTGDNRHYQLRRLLGMGGFDEVYEA